MAYHFPIIPILEHYGAVIRGGNGHRWTSCTCPFHGDHNASASFNEEAGAFRCHACPAKGDALALVQYKEGCTFEEALVICQEVTGVQDAGLSQPVVQRRRRPVLRISQQPGPDGGDHATVPARGRRRPRRL